MANHKIICLAEHCEWANGPTGHCIWPGTYCPKQGTDQAGLVVISPLRMPQWVRDYLARGKTTEQRNESWYWKARQLRKDE